MTITVFRPIALFTHPRYLDHDTGGGGHPEIPGRIVSILNKIEASSIAPYINTMRPRPAERKWITCCHDESYLYRFEEAALSGRSHIDHQDNQISYDSFEVATLAAGAGLNAIDYLEQGNGNIAFCCVRPPGHHAERAMALGFCFFNNAAIAARYWQHKYHRQRIAIIDFDAHHGNGIQAAFEEDPDVFYVSIHEHPTFSFPGTGYAEEKGTGAGEGATLNIPLTPGTNDSKFLHAMHEEIMPALEKFSPEALIVSAGFDGHQLDDMSGLAYTTELYGRLGELLSNFSIKFCRGKVLNILEGGYHLEALAASVVAYLTPFTKVPE
jgi:acetoin utilization deacetylase AcuC-like enzyme